jgi:hypothetical protein
METVPQNTSAPPAPPTQSVADDLKGIRGALENLSQKADAWAKDNNLDQPEPEHAGDNRSRAIAALGMAVVGWKAGAILGAKVGFIVGGVKDRFSAVRELASVRKLEDAWKILKSMYLPQTAIGGAVGSVVGITLAGLVGWIRGDRIKNPKDFFAHPLKSFATLIFGEDKLKETAPAAPAPQATADTTPSNKTGTTNWQSRTTQTVKAPEYQR